MTACEREQHRLRRALTSRNNPPPHPNTHTQALAAMAEPQQVTEQKEAVGGRDSDTPADVSAIDKGEMAADVLNPVAGGLAEPAADNKPGEGEVQDMPASADKLEKLEGDVGKVGGPGFGSVQGGIAAHGGTDAPSVAESTDTTQA